MRKQRRPGHTKPAYLERMDALAHRDVCERLRVSKNGRSARRSALWSVGAARYPERRIPPPIHEKPIFVQYTIPTGAASAILTLSAGNDADTTDETLTLTLGEGIGGSGITISLNGQPPTGGVRVHFTISGTATAGEDWAAPTNNWVVIDQQPSRSATIAVDVTDDTRVEGDETVIVTLDRVTDTSDTTIMGIAASGATTVTIADDDDPGASMAIVAGS